MREIVDIPEDKKLYVIDFYAEWCGHCRSVFPELEKLEKENPDVTFVKMNVDNIGDEIIKEFNMTELPVIIAYKNGKEKSRYREQDGTLASWCKFIQW